MNAKEEAEGEGTSRAPSRRLDAAEGDDDEEDSMAGTILQVYLHTAPSSFDCRMKFGELWRTFSAVAWCGKSNLIACATEICARDPRSNSQPAFWIPVHIVNPERPTEHTVFNVVTDSPCDSLQYLEWSPVSCPRALLIANSWGRVTVWTQPTQGHINVARAVNCWSCEHGWRQDQALVTKWLGGVSAYRWTTATSSSSFKSSFEEKFISHQPRASTRWPSFLCVCTIFTSGSVQLHWCQWPPSQSGGSPKWFCTSKGVLGAGPSGIIAGDAIVSETGALLVAGVPIGNPSTVVIWEVSPWGLNNQGSSQQIAVKFGGSLPASLLFNPAAWPGVAPIAAYLLSWHENLGADFKVGQLGVDAKGGPPIKEIKAGLQSADTRQGQPLADAGERYAPLLHCSPVSNMSAYVTPEAASQSVTTGWGTGVAAVAFDPARGGSALAVLVLEGHYISPRNPDEGPSLTGYRVQHWESSRQQVAIHPLFETAVGSYTSPSPPMTTTWKSVVDKRIQSTKYTLVGENAAAELLAYSSEQTRFTDVDYPSSVRPRPKIVFSPHGGEVAVAVFGGEVHIFSGSNFTPVDNYCVRVGVYSIAPAFSASGCCLSTVWHDSNRECSILKVLRVHPPAIPGMQVSSGSVNWERSLADRLWWSLISEVDWWDAVGCIQSAVEDGVVTFQKVVAVMDADFHALPTPAYRQHYSPALDRIKCRMLEGVEGSDVRAVVLDMQARLLLEMLGKGIEAALTNPATLFPEPWQASSETLSQLVSDAMAVDPALVPYIQSYVDSVLDLASHFLTRLRRYASFCRTLATHAAGSTSTSVTNSRIPSANSGSTGTTPAPAQGTQGTSGSGNGTTSVQAWVQGAIAKVNNTTEGAVSLGSTAMTGTVPPLQLSVSQAAFPGMPAVRLIGDRHFLHKLCQLLLFCLIFRRRQLPRYIGAPSRNPDGNNLASKPVSPFGGKGTEDTVTSNSTTRSMSVTSAVKSEEAQSGRGSGQAVSGIKGPDELGAARSVRLGSGNAGQGYTSDEVKYLFLVSVDLCKRTSSLQHPMPKSQVGTLSPSIRLHYPDGQYSVVPEVVEASLGPHIQNLPRPRGADSAGLLMRELELHPPAEDWNKRNLFGGPWARALELQVAADEQRILSGSFGQWSATAESSLEDPINVKELWPRKRRYAERDTAFGLRTGVGMGGYLGFMGSRRDTITTAWKSTPHGVWHKCMRCGRQTGSLFSSSSAAMSNQTSSGDISWWLGRWAYACPMCEGPWLRIV